MDVAVDGPVDGVGPILNTDDWYDIDDDGVAKGRDEKVSRLRFGRDGVASVCCCWGLVDSGGRIMPSEEFSFVCDGIVICVSLVPWLADWLASSAIDWLICCCEACESSLKMAIDLSGLLDGFHPSKSGKSRRLSSIESSENKYASLLALARLFLIFARGKNLLFFGDVSTSPSSSHRRSFFCGRFGGADWVTTAGDGSKASSRDFAGAGLLATRASILDIGSVFRR